MRSLLLAASMLPLLGGCVGHSSIPDDPTERLRSETVLYIEAIASGDRFEIESGQLALARSANPAVRDYASAMIAAHTAMSDRLLAATHTVRPANPAFALISHHFEMLERLGAAGPEFDSLYRDFQVQVHQEAIALDRNYATSGNVVALAALAQDALAMAQAHLQQAQQLPVPPTPVAPVPPPPPPGPPRSTGERG